MERFIAGWARQGLTLLQRMSMPGQRREGTGACHHRGLHCRVAGLVHLPATACTLSKRGPWMHCPHPSRCGRWRAKTASRGLRRHRQPKAVSGLKQAGCGRHFIPRYRYYVSSITCQAFQAAGAHVGLAVTAVGATVGTSFWFCKSALTNATRPVAQPTHRKEHQTCWGRRPWRQTGWGA